MKAKTIKIFFDTFFDRQVQFHSAALAFYSIIALPSFFLLFVSVSTLFLSEATVIGWLTQANVSQTDLLRQGTVQFFNISSATTIASALLLIWSGSAMFQRVQYGLRDMWQIELNIGGGVRTFLANRLLAIIAALIFVVAIITLFFFTQIVGFVITQIGTIIPSVEAIVPIAFVVQFILLFGVLALTYGLFGDSHVSSVLLFGSTGVVALIMFVIQYGSQQLIQSLFAVNWYGAAGSLVLLLILVYILSMVFYAGAVWMYVIAKRRHNDHYIRPRDYAKERHEPHSFMERLVQLFS